MKANSEPGRAADLRAGRLRLRHRLGRRTRARARRRRRPGQGGVFRRRQDARRDAPRARGRACSASTSKARPNSSCCRMSPATTGKRARVSLRVNPDVDAGTHPYISTGLKDNKFGIAHDARRSRPTGAPRAAGYRGRRHRLPHRLADHRHRALPRRARQPAGPGRGRRVERHRACTTSTWAAGSASPTPTNRRPRSRNWSRACCARIDARGHGHRKIVFEPGRSLVGNAGVLRHRGAVPEARPSGARRRRTSASSTRP